MAGGLDIARTTRLIRKRQKVENDRAIKEADQRRTEAEELLDLSPSELRRRNNAQRREAHERQRLASLQAKMDREPYEDKMDREGGGSEKTRESAGGGEGGPEDGGKGPEGGAANLTHEDAVSFASEAARELAEELGLGEDVISEFVPTGKTGYTKGDVEEIAAALAEEAEG